MCLDDLGCELDLQPACPKRPVNAGHVSILHNAYICHCSGMKRSSLFLMDTVKSNLHFSFIAHPSLHRNTSYCGRKMGCERRGPNYILISYPSSFVNVTSPDVIGCFFKCGPPFWTKK